MRAFLLSLWLLSSVASSARADGFFVQRSRDADIREPEQKALIVFDGRQEDLVLSVRYEGAPEDFGWIIPLPRVPEMYPEDILLFEELSVATHRRQARGGARLARASEHLGLVGIERVEVVKEQDVGIYKATVLRADDGTALREWLDVHGYEMPTKGKRILKRYIEEGWLFAALKIRSQEMDSTTTSALSSGTIQPVRFCFPCEEPVFPLEITSVASEESEVLLYVLAPEILVPRVPSSDFWDYQIYSHPGGHQWIGAYERNAPDSIASFLPGPADSFFLTKSRADFRRQEMKDIIFEVFDAERGLRHGNPHVRADAATHLGFRKPAHAIAALNRFLAQPLSSPDAYSAIWALGEIGGVEAEHVLLKHLRDGDPWLRVEAAESLGRLRSRAAMPIFVQNLSEGPLKRRGFVSDAETEYQQICFENLVAFGDQSCIPELKRLAESHGGYQEWGRIARHRIPIPFERLWPEELSALSLRAVAALAAIGEEAARRTISQAIVAGSGCIQPDSLRRTASLRGARNGFPRGFWTGYVTLIGDRALHPWTWNAWSVAAQLLESRPDARDEVYRAAARDARLPATGAVMLLADVSEPTSDDTELLMKIWNRSLQPPVETIAVHCDRNLPWESETVHFNHVACCVAYALSRWKRVDELAHLWNVAPENDPVLRGEIIHAIAWTRDPRFAGPVLEYVRDVWASNAAAYERHYRETPMDERAEPSPFWSHRAALDLPHRIDAVMDWFQAYGDSTIVGDLLTDRGLPAYLRLALFDNTPYRIGKTDHFARIALAELTELVDRERAENPLVERFAEPVRRKLEYFHDRSRGGGERSTTSRP